jgi:DNA-binding NarL/FixJ family response regulator
MGVPVLFSATGGALQKTIQRFLSGCEEVDLIGIATTIPSTVAMLKQLRPPVLVFDLRMTMRDPHKCEELLAAKGKTELVALSFGIDEETRRLAAACGATCIVDKMKLASDLLPEIRRCVAPGGHAA